MSRKSNSVVQNQCGTIVSMRVIVWMRYGSRDSDPGHIRMSMLCSGNVLWWNVRRLRQLVLGESTEVLQPCRLTDQIRLNTAGEKRQRGSKGERGRKGKKGRECEGEGGKGGEQRKWGKKGRNRGNVGLCRNIHRECVVKRQVEKRRTGRTKAQWERNKRTKPAIRRQRSEGQQKESVLRSIEWKGETLQVDLRK